MHRTAGVGAVLEAEASADRTDERVGLPLRRYGEDEHAPAPASPALALEGRGGHAHEPVPAAAPPRGGDRGPKWFDGEAIGPEPSRSRGQDRVRDPDHAAECVG